MRIEQQSTYIFVRGQADQKELGSVSVIRWLQFLDDQAVVGLIGGEAGALIGGSSVLGALCVPSIC